MEKYTDYLGDRDEFSKVIGEKIKERVFNELDSLKKEMSKDFIKDEESDESQGIQK